ncbi:MAG: hypothetical protein KDD35_05635 [Bdellovibrionales bacterium]|nr:hypothetical protein [Bdellovibrionales bacterium]
MVTNLNLFNKVVVDQFLADHIEIFTAFRRSLADYMYKINKFRVLAAVKVASHLIRLRHTSKIQYIQKIGLLLSSMLYKTPQSLWFANQLIKLALRESRLPERYEMRIPVAIPNEFIEIGNSSCKGFLGK